MQVGNPMELNLEGLVNAKMKYINWQSSKSRWEKWGHLSSYHVYLQNYDLNNKNGSFFVFSVDDSKKLDTVWEKYFDAAERSY